MPIYENYKQTRSPARVPQANPVASGYLTMRSAPRNIHFTASLERS